MTTFWLIFTCRSAWWKFSAPFFISIWMSHNVTHSISYNIWWDLNYFKNVTKRVVAYSKVYKFINISGLTWEISTTQRRRSILDSYQIVVHRVHACTCIEDSRGRCQHINPTISVHFISQNKCYVQCSKSTTNTTIVYTCMSTLFLNTFMQLAFTQSIIICPINLQLFMPTWMNGSTGSIHKKWRGDRTWRQPSSHRTTLRNL